MTGCDLVTSLDPLTGNTNWEVEGATTECVTSTITDGQHIFTSGGYPKNHMSAVKADGSKQLVGENKERVYVPSLLIKDGYLYGVLDAGIAMCWEAATGKEMWKERLGGNYSASPVLVGDLMLPPASRAKRTFLKSVLKPPSQRQEQVRRRSLRHANLLGAVKSSCATLCKMVRSEVRSWFASESRTAF